MGVCWPSKIQQMKSIHDTAYGKANRKQETLISIIQQWIHPGSIIHSDCSKSYKKLSKIGYTHVTVNHSKEFLNETMLLAQMQLRVIGDMPKC